MKLPLLIVLPVLWLVLADPKASKDDVARLQGVWEVACFEYKETQLPAEKTKRYRLTIKGGKMSHPGNKEGEVEESTFTVDATKSPKHIDMTPTRGVIAGKVLPGIYLLDGDTFKLCYDEPGKPRPEEFNNKLSLITFKRVKP